MPDYTPEVVPDQPTVAADECSDAAPSADDPEPVPTGSPVGGAFPGLLRRYRERAGLSQNALAERAGRDPGTVNRLESGKRAPVNRELLADLARALGLTPDENAVLLAAAGHLPDGLARVALADPDLRLVAGILADERIPPDERREFRLALRLAARRWRRVSLVIDEPTPI